MASCDQIPTFTPGYMSARGIPNNETTYNMMSEWHTGAGRRLPQGVPVSMSDGNWRECTQAANQKPVEEDKYIKAYNELQKRIAYRYPNPGPPRVRQGRIGGSWRHIKEVQGHGSRVVFVDDISGSLPAETTESRRRVGGSWNDVKETCKEDGITMTYVDDGSPQGHVPDSRRRVGGSYENVKQTLEHGGQHICYVTGPRKSTGLPVVASAQRRRIGGSWGHIKEVLQHSGSRSCFVDGLVRMYDQDRSNQQPPRITVQQTLYAPMEPTSKLPRIDPKGFCAASCPVHPNGPENVK